MSFHGKLGQADGIHGIVVGTVADATAMLIGQVIDPSLAPNPTLRTVIATDINKCYLNLTDNAIYILRGVSPYIWEAIGTSVSPGVTSFNGRTGDVLPQSGDYPSGSTTANIITTDALTAGDYVTIYEASGAKVKLANAALGFAGQANGFVKAAYNKSVPTAVVGGIPNHSKIGVIKEPPPTPVKPLSLIHI